ncbi:MAG: hypothetical protein M3373_10205 [Gemmatimonadota bacterium]|nr:hypothetical protein [Gemmatimonadota bacterium]
MTRLLFVLTVVGGVALAAPLGAQGREQVPREYRPPPGMCRIWIDSVPAERQPEPTDCPTAIRRRPPNARVVFGDDVSRNLRPRKADDREEPKPPEDKRETGRKPAKEPVAERRPSVKRTLP